VFKALSEKGNAAQQQYKVEHGVVSGYQQRKVALQKPDRTNTPKRKRRTALSSQETSEEEEREEAMRCLESYDN
jgi:hypothetical protein